MNESQDNINLVAQDWETPISWALKNHNNANPNHIHNGMTHLNTLNKQSTCDMISIDSSVRLFIKLGNDPNCMNNNGQTLLTFIIKISTECDTLYRYKYQTLTLNLIEFLIQNGANVNKRNSDYSTPLHYAAKYRDIQLTQLLIKYGARVDEQRFHTPLATALHSDHMHIARFLLEKFGCVKYSDINFIVKTQNDDLIQTMLPLLSENQKMHAIKINEIIQKKIVNKRVNKILKNIKLFEQMRENHIDKINGLKTEKETITKNGFIRANTLNYRSRFSKKHFNYVSHDFDLNDLFSTN